MLSACPSNKASQDIANLFNRFFASQFYKDDPFDLEELRQELDRAIQGMLDLLISVFFLASSAISPKVFISTEVVPSLLSCRRDFGAKLENQGSTACSCRSR